MITETINVPVETIKYNFILVEALKKDNSTMLTAINEVLEVLNSDGVPNTDWIKNRLNECLNKK
jgi:hypothetical protein